MLPCTTAETQTNLGVSDFEMGLKSAAKQLWDTARSATQRLVSETVNFPFGEEEEDGSSPLSPAPSS